MNLPSFSDARVLVVGDAMLDRYWLGDVDRISPEAPVPVVAVAEQQARAGGAANVAQNIASMSANATLLCVTGDDASADELEALLTAEHVGTALIREVGARTTEKFRVLARNQQLIRLDFDHEPGEPALANLQQKFQDLLGSTDVLVLSDYGKGVLTHVQDLIEAARAADKPVVVDPKGNDFDRYRGATIITPNWSEFVAVVGDCDSELKFHSCAQELRESLELQMLLVTRGDKGMTLFREGNAASDLPAKATEVFDVSGAGDTVVASFALALAAGMNDMDSLHFANTAAGVVVRKIGTATVSLDEINTAFKTGKGI
ncbi:MAG TPA: D-glycero-beta-D-manno-heptose-7-phosphate kinase [Gammaproteobacteria bacterium]|jgi:D-glycero-beta-D-manno-heptose-7-phosphate kinase|nr:D-glycero-beta-D-manno-heptose-7-phosphate kinase [Gammaproteobacteria bacterium]